MATPEQIPSDLTLEIGVDLAPEAFLAAARHFFGLVQEIANETAQQPVGWTVQVREGSNLIAVVPDALSADDQLEAIYAKFRAGTAALMRGDIDAASLGERALGHFRGLSQLTAAKRVPIPLRFWVKRNALDLGPQIAAAIQEDWRTEYQDFGTIEGKLQAIRESGNRLRISVKDLLYARPIDCVLPEGMVEEALSKFRKRVEVSGLIHYRKNGAPVSIEVSQIEVLPDDDDLPSDEDVRGILA